MQFMASLYRLSVFGLLALVAGCATGPKISTHTMPQVDFSDYETFGWPAELGTDRGGYETRITQYFKQAARREMESLGYVYSEDDPDLLVNFYTRVEAREGIRTRPAMVPTFSTGYYGYRFGMYSAWPVYATEIDTFQYTLGTANIDVVDASEMRLLWEGRAEGRLTADSLSNARSEISETVAEIFERFPTRLAED
jgi:hypothetical protein